MRRFAKSLKADMSSEGSNPSLSVPLLCKGSTGDFDSSSLGSNPSEGTGVYSSGQRGQTVNLLPFGYEGSNPSAPIRHLSRVVMRLTCNEQIAGSIPADGFKGRPDIHTYRR